jgi:hypothetical protein
MAFCALSFLWLDTRWNHTAAQSARAIARGRIRDSTLCQYFPGAGCIDVLGHSMEFRVDKVISGRRHVEVDAYHDLGPGRGARIIGYYTRPDMAGNIPSRAQMAPFCWSNDVTDIIAPQYTFREKSRRIAPNVRLSVKLTARNLSECQKRNEAQGCSYYRVGMHVSQRRQEGEVTGPGPRQAGHDSSRHLCAGCSSQQCDFRERHAGTQEVLLPMVWERLPVSGTLSPVWGSR